MLALLEGGNVLDCTLRERSLWNHYTIEEFAVEPLIGGSKRTLRKIFYQRLIRFLQAKEQFTVLVGAFISQRVLGQSYSLVRSLTSSSKLITMFSCALS